MSTIRTTTLASLASMALCGSAAALGTDSISSDPGDDGVYLRYHAIGFKADGQWVHADSEEAAVVTVDVYVELPGVRPRLLSISNMEIETTGLSPSFLHDDDHDGSWRIQDSNTTNGWYEGDESKFDSFLTISPVNPEWNSTVLVGSLPGDSPLFIYGEEVGWTNPTPENMQGDSSDDLVIHEMFIARFVIEPEEYRNCGRFDLSLDVRYTDPFFDAGDELTTSKTMTFENDACSDPPAEGDINGDGRVDGDDLASLLGAWGESGVTADLNGDGLVDGQDLSQLLAHWNG